MDVLDVLDGEWRFPIWCLDWVFRKVRMRMINANENIQILIYQSIRHFDLYQGVTLNGNWCPFGLVI